MGREARLPRIPDPPFEFEVDDCVEDPWWLPTIMPDLTWAHLLLEERERSRRRARVALSALVVLASRGRILL